MAAKDSQRKTSGVSKVSSVIWSDYGGLQLAKRITDLAAKNPAAAVKAAKAINEDLKRVAAYPMAGKPRPDIGAEYHEFFIRFGAGGYSLVYRVEKDVTEIVNIKHYRERGYEWESD